MLILLLRYFFVYWILLGGSASEETLLRDLNLELKDYPIAGCKLRCMHRLRKHRFTGDLTPNQACTDHCNRDNTTTVKQLEKYRYIQLNYRMILVCRDDKSLTFRILHVRSVGNATQINGAEIPRHATQRATNGNEYKNILFKKKDEEHTAFTLSMDIRDPMQATMTNPNGDSEQMSELSDAIFMVKVQGDTNATTVYMSYENFFTITDLNNFTTYTISAVAVTAKHEYTIVTKGEKFSTLQHDYTPGSVADMNLRRYLPDDTNEMHLMADITWQPSADRTCSYFILYYDESGADMISMEIRNPRQLYTYTLENLTFSAVYKVGILAKNTKNASKESAMKWLKIQTPSCAEWYNYNFTICPPFPPKNLKVDRKYIRESTYSLNVTWDKPEHPISSYIIVIVDGFDTFGREYNFTVNKSSTVYFIPEIELNGTLFDVHLIACTPGGNASVFTQEVNNRTLLLPENSQLNAKYVAAMIVALSCLGFIFFYGRYRYAKYKRHQQRCKYFRDLESKAPIDPKATFDFPTKNLITSTSNFSQFQYLEDKMFLNDAMEIDRADVTLLEVLGEGAFGLVRRGLYNDGKVGVREVAVKMLKEHPPLDDERAFRREIEVMKSVEPHPNIVGIIGHCTKPSHQMLLLTEYCSFGNLLDFLRDEWKYLYELNVKTSGSILKRKFGGLSRTSGKKRHRRVSHNLTETHHQSTGSEGNSNSNSIDHPNSNCTDRPNDYKSRGNGSGSFGGVLGNSGASIDGNIVESLKFRYKYLNTLQQQQQQQQQQQTPTTSIYPPSYDISATTTMTSITTINDSAPPPPPTPLQSPTSYWAADNKSYGYEDICCRACKYHMNVDSVGKKHATSLNGVDVGVGVNGDHTTMQQIGCEKQKQIHEFHSKNCVCQQKLLNANQTVVTQQQHHHQQQQQQQEQPLEQQAFGSVAGPKSAGAIENKSYFKLFHEILSEAAWRRRQWERRHARAAFCNRRLAFTGVHIESSTTTTTTTTTPTPTPTPTTTAASIISQADKTGDNEALSSCLHRQPLTTADLLDIARQVAVGMEYLAKNKVVHRDLAARNVLVATDRTIKIADFGLSRDVYQENIYKKTGNGKLPIKWLALESMTHQVYTTQSDVWSYGILLYEIVTLGSTPYPSTPTNRLLNLLKSGYRMERPKNCGPEFYNLMYACWNVNPCERPTFSEIIKILNDFLLDEPERHGTLLGLPNMECMEQCASRLLNLHKEEQPKQEIEETPQSSPDDDKMIDTSNMDDSYLKPLQAKNKSTND